MGGNYMVFSEKLAYSLLHECIQNLSQLHYKELIRQNKKR